jgi:hypothetical protein
MDGVIHHDGERGRSSWSTVRHVLFAVIFSIPPAVLLHQWFPQRPKLRFDVQVLPLERQFGEREYLITVLTIWNDGDVPLTGLAWEAKLDGPVHYCTGNPQGCTFAPLHIGTAGIRTAVRGGSGQLPVGGRLSVGIVSSGSLTGAPEVVSNEVVGALAAPASTLTGMRALIVSACVAALLGTSGYIIWVLRRQTIVTRRWARMLAEYARALRRSTTRGAGFGER